MALMSEQSSLIHHVGVSIEHGHLGNSMHVDARCLNARRVRVHHDIVKECQPNKAERNGTITHQP